MNEIEQKTVEFLNSETGMAIKKLIAFTIRKTKSLKDDEILENIDEVVSIVAKNINDIAEIKPTDKEAKEAAMAVLKVVVDNTETKWDDRAYAILDMFL